MSDGEWRPLAFTVLAAANPEDVTAVVSREVKMLTSAGADLYSLVVRTERNAHGLVVVHTHGRRSTKEN